MRKKKSEEQRKLDKQLYYQKNKERIQLRHKHYREQNLEKIKKISKESGKSYYLKNKTKINERNNLNYQKNKDNIKIKQTEYRLKNKEKIQEYFDKNRERFNGNIKNYYKNNPDKMRAKGANRRASELQATPKWLTKEHKKQILSFYKEALTLTKNTGVSHQVDHQIPLKGKTVCGLHVPWNLQVLTAEENNIKNNKLVI